MSRYYRNSSCGCNDRVSLTTDNQTNKTLIVPVPGIPGDKGDKQVTLFAKNASNTIPPLVSRVPNPSGWSTQPPTLEEGEYEWKIVGELSYDSTILVSNWSEPVVSATSVEVEPVSPETDNDIFI